MTPPGGSPPHALVTKEIIPGTGKVAKAGDHVTVNYVGVLYSDGSKFDASWDRNEPFSFTLGAHEVIPGWEQGVAGMRVGGRRELIIPSALGYGATRVAAEDPTQRNAHLRGGPARRLASVRVSLRPPGRGR